MDAMMLGETLAADVDERFAGFWMPTAGSEGIAAVQVFAIALEVDSKIVVRIETKSSGEDDSLATEAGSVNITATTPQIHRFAVTDAKDLVRYSVEFKASADFVHCQFLAPTWAPN